MLHVISAQCVACDLHTFVPGLLEHMCWRRFAAQWGDCKNSQMVPLNVITIIIIIISHSTTTSVLATLTPTDNRHQLPSTTTQVHAPASTAKHTGCCWLPNWLPPISTLPLITTLSATNYQADYCQLPHCLQPNTKLATTIYHTVCTYCHVGYHSLLHCLTTNTILATTIYQQLLLTTILGTTIYQTGWNESPHWLWPYTSLIAMDYHTIMYHTVC